ncbi:AUGMIN subunit 6 [Nymphaea thermarum]|nr:AUGMIN subunit 6 [Nymphaea thermarum]
MTMDREKEREVELESAMYTNCLLLGLDPSVLGMSNGMPKTGLFRHSNPRMGETLLHFILSALRGPAQAAKDFDKVWPIFDATQSRDFRKIVQGIINELESQGALPRSNSRVSSLATCCGQRFVELLWQLSVHALREVHKRAFAADVAADPLPESLTDISYLHAAALLPVTKARIALERRKFLKTADVAVRRQATWSSLAHDMTAEFRSLCAEEAYLQQELEKLHDLRNKVKLEGELWDGRVASSLDQNSHLVSKATRLWDSLLSRRSQHEVLASGPIEDLIAHREHRYRISGSSLLAAMDQSSQLAPDTLSIQAGDLKHADKQEYQEGSLLSVKKEKQKSSSEQIHSQVSDEDNSRVDDRGGKVQPVVDVAEVLRCWTHALQRIHKQALILAKSNDGEGPELLRATTSNSSSSHAESLSTTLAEHRQHLASIQVLISQLKAAIPSMQDSISQLTDEVNSFSAVALSKDPTWLATSIHPQSGGRATEDNIVQPVESERKFPPQPEQFLSSPALKLPHLFTLTPNSSAKSGMAQRRQIVSAHQTNKPDELAECSKVERPLVASHEDNSAREDSVQNLKRSIRASALCVPPNGMGLPRDNKIDTTEHYFIPLSTDGLAQKDATVKATNRGKPLRSPQELCILNNGLVDERDNGSILDESDDLAGHLDHACRLMDDEYTSEFLSAVSPNYMVDNRLSLFHNIWDGQDHALSPPLLIDASLAPDTYEDLLAPLSETEDALMER